VIKYLIQFNLPECQFDTHTHKAELY